MQLCKEIAREQSGSGKHLSGLAFSVILFLFSVFLSCTNSGDGKTSDTEAIPEEAADNWIDLFDGKTFAGWRILGSDSVFTTFWKIEDGMIKKIDRGKVPQRSDGQPQQGGDLMTDSTFENFELSWEWRLFESGNSGLKYNVSEEMSIAQGSQHAALGFEYQLLDDSAPEWKDLKPEQFSGALYDLIPPHNVKLKPLGEFNQSRIIVNGNKVEHWLNGEVVVTYSFDSPELETAYQKSKFAKIPHFKEKRKGHIVLQDHITEAWFRNIRIRKL